jgi:deoxyribonuclease-4
MKLGSHMSVAGGVHTAFARAESVGGTALQIFVKNASQWAAKPLPEEEIRLFAEERKRTGILPVVAHDSYLINLASPAAALWKMSIRAMVNELERCELLALDGLVAHPGSHVGSGESQGLKRIAQGLDDVFRRSPGLRVPILLETTAGQGSNLGWRFEQLATIRDLVREPERISFCLDTCHVFAAGYDLRTAGAVAATLDEFDQVCGLRDLKAVHLNDSLKPFESRRDRHAHIGEGEIGRAGFAAFMTDPRLADVPMVLETPKGDEAKEDARNLELIRALAAGTMPKRKRAMPTEAWRKGTLKGAAKIARERSKARRDANSDAASGSGR